MDLLKTMFGNNKDNEDEEVPEFKQIKKYRICVEDNPDEKRYRCGNKKDTISPNCKLTVYLEELTHEEARELDLEIRNMLERHNLQLR